VLILQYCIVTTAILDDGQTTSFWFDAWPEVGRLVDILPALRSYCLVTNVIVADVDAGGLTHLTICNPDCPLRVCGAT
jgi:hypothetical protein